MIPGRFSNKYFFLILTLLVYIGLSLVTFNNGYFWDTIQQISKEAHWFYQNNFSALLMPSQDSGFEIVATGYHPPLMGIITAILWTLFGYKLWVSHVFVLLWLIILVYNAWKLICLFFEEKFVGWVFLIAMLEPTVLTQFAISSPDFILFTAFVVSLRAVLERKPILLAIALFFLCGINMRGIFVGAILFVVYCYQSYLQDDNTNLKRNIFKNILPFLPIVLILASYYIYYFSQLGWFFANEPSTGHYALPTSPMRIVSHFAELGLRSIENGRFFIWFLGCFVVINLLKKKQNLSQNSKLILLSWILLTSLYLLFVFISQMPFSSRYFMPQYFLLTILILQGTIKLFDAKRIYLVFILILFFEITGNFWIYPDKIAKSWDCTLAHLPYYGLRQDCFDYIDQQGIDYNNVSSGFCMAGNRKYVELENDGKFIGYKAGSKYFIYSNISNLDDELVAKLMNTHDWKVMRRFEKGFVFIEILERVNQKSK